MTVKRRSMIALLVARACIEPVIAQETRLPGSLVKPVVLGESHYDGGWGPKPDDFTTRRQAWWAMLSGAAGHTYGAEAMASWGQAKWRLSFDAAMNLPSAAQMKHVSALLTARLWYRLVPDFDGKVMTGGIGDGVDRATTARADDGSLVIAYLPTVRTVTIDLAQLAAPVAARWFDPTNGQYRPIVERLASGGSRDFAPPARNSIGQTDWVLVLETNGPNAALLTRPAKFPLRVSANGRYFVDSSGWPFFYQADTPWWMIWKSRPSEVRAYLDNRKARGFTTLQAMLLPAGSETAGEIVNAADVNGNRPFANGKALDPASVNEAYMKHADQVIAQATAAGFYLVLTPAWFGSKGNDYEGVINEGNAAAWARYLAKRYGRFQNIAWIMAGDSNAEGKTSAVRAMAMTLKALAPHQLVTAHAEVRSSSEQYHRESWLDYNMAYDYTWGGGWVYPQVQRDYRGPK
jgi:hypothetical protein